LLHLGREVKYVALSLQKMYFGIRYFQEFALYQRKSAALPPPSGSAWGGPPHFFRRRRDLSLTINKADCHGSPEQL
jgi:hypothetical protein